LDNQILIKIDVLYHSTHNFIEIKAGTLSQS